MVLSLPVHRVHKLLDHGYLHLDFEGWSHLEPQVQDPVRGLLQTYSAKAIPNGTLGLGYPCNCKLVGDLCVSVILARESDRHVTPTH